MEGQLRFRDATAIYCPMVCQIHCRRLTSVPSAAHRSTPPSADTASAANHMQTHVTLVLVAARCTLCHHSSRPLGTPGYGQHYSTKGELRTYKKNSPGWTIVLMGKRRRHLAGKSRKVPASERISSSRRVLSDTVRMRLRGRRVDSSTPGEESRQWRKPESCLASNETAYYPHVAAAAPCKTHDAIDTAEAHMVSALDANTDIRSAEACASATHTQRSCMR